MVRILGDWAEQRFALLCAEAGVLCNKSQQDRTGWDFIVEFPPDKVPNIPHDMQPTDRSARVQVKSTEGEKLATRVKLSNALRFVNEPSPCFIVLFKPESEGKPEEIYARHFGEDLIAVTLRKAREAAAKDRADLHKIMLPISFGDEHRRSSDLLQWMAREVPAQTAAYAATKANLARTVGYEDGLLTSTVTFKDVPVEKLIDHQLGFVEKIEVENVSISNIRFGVEIPVLNLGKPTFAQITPNPQSCRIRIRGRKGKDIWLDGKIFVPINLGQPDIRFKVEADFIALYGDSANPGNLTASLDHEKKCTIDDLIARQMFRLAAQSGPIDIRIFYQNTALAGFSGDIALDASIWPELFLNVLDALDCVSRNLRPADLLLSANDLEKAWQELADFHGLVKGLDLKAKISFDRAFPVDGLQRLLAHGHVLVGGWSFAAVVSREIIAKQWVSESTLAIECGEPRILETIVRHGEADIVAAEIATLHVRTRTSLGNGVIEICDGDYASMMLLSGRNPADRGTGADQNLS